MLLSRVTTVACGSVAQPCPLKAGHRHLKTASQADRGSVLPPGWLFQLHLGLNLSGSQFPPSNMGEAALSPGGGGGWY